MSFTLAVNDANDLYLAADGYLARAEDLQATLQAAQQAAATVLGEMIYSTDDGVLYFEAAWSGVPNLPQFEASLRRAILGVEAVQKISALTITQSGDELSYTATIETDYGTAILNG